MGYRLLTPTELIGLAMELGADAETLQTLYDGGYVIVRAVEPEPVELPAPEAEQR